MTVENARQGSRWGVGWWLRVAMLFVVLWIVAMLIDTTADVPDLQPWAGVAVLLAVIALSAAAVQWFRRGR